MKRLYYARQLWKAKKAGKVQPGGPAQSVGLLNAMGRSGTTALMQALRCHPQVVIPDAYPYENLICQQWEAIAQTLTKPRGANAPPEDRVIKGMNPFYLRQFDPQQDMDKIRSDMCRSTVDFCRDQVLQYYGSIPGPSGPRTIIEKRAGKLRNVDFGLLFPDFRQVSLLRDFRDIMASIIMFDEKRGFYGFGRKDGEALVPYTQRMADSTFARVVELAKPDLKRGAYMRFDELLRADEEAIRRVLKGFDLDATDASVQQIRDGLAQRHDYSSAHKTTKESESRQDKRARAFGKDLEVMEQILAPLNRAIKVDD